MKGNNLIYILIIAIVFAFSCKNYKTKISDTIIIKDIKVPANYSSSVIWMDYEDAIITGFIIPSKKQTTNGYFNFAFTLKNNSAKEDEYYYKIYYQNESYKWPEVSKSNPILQHEFAHENFYGSWEDTNIEFKFAGKIKPGETVNIRDSFRILGNPRNEDKYFWEGENDRWKRNPRVGDYSFMIVVVNKSDYQKIPEYIKNIKLTKDNTFINPFYYFRFGDGKKFENLKVEYIPKFINVKASPDLGKGIYIQEWKFGDNNSKDFRKFYSCTCGTDEKLYKNATVSQFLHYIDESSKFDNIPVIADVFDGNFTKEEYNWVRAFYKTKDRIRVLPKTAPQPCEIIHCDTVNKKITIRNPKSEFGNWQKQNAGMITRHGFAYGKFTVKAKLTRLLNDDGVWNGITNAIWLIYQGGRGENETGWNLRRPCRKKGYMKTYWGGRLDDRVERVAYSEIDFEILKTVPYCPDNCYPPIYENFEGIPTKINAWNIKLPADVLKDDKNIAVCCTNWDMACWEPKNFSTGCHPVKHENKTYLAHRWEDVYRAITTKYMAPDKELFGRDYYYFQIDWQPDKIIWRIGPEKDKLYEVGYVDYTVSMIPDNQMLLIVTQEFHNTNWWPGSPYLQENIPFPAKDYVGEIFEITIE
ncbi:MAG TPA: hypothetical protein PK262_00850 [Bacteroidales bacterium]|nr:hypothetical protein [Bacteroidales bacterium]